MRPGLNERSKNKLVYIFYYLHDFYSESTLRFGTDAAGAAAVESRRPRFADLENHVRLEIDRYATLTIISLVVNMVQIEYIVNVFWTRRLS